MGAAGVARPGEEDRGRGLLGGGGLKVEEADNTIIEWALLSCTPYVYDVRCTELSGICGRYVIYID